MSRGVVGKLPNFAVAPVLEWRAQRIDDPVAKLRFLRQAMGDEWNAEDAPPLAPLQARVLLKPSRYLALAACVTACLLLPLPTAPDTNEPMLRDRVVAASGKLHTEEKFQNVWPIEQNDAYEVYSNGLRIENQYAVQNQMRFYQAYDQERDYALSPQWRTQPAGIVFHTTESHITPFAEDYANKMKQIGEGLLSLIKQNRSYHYVIDRFGRVFRVVIETDVANHAGNSIWADRKWTYLNLNNSFLGVAFEAQTQEGDEPTAVTPAQMHAARILTEMLRGRYSIPGSNCVTHAQVSVNPSNMLIGYHTDWGANFPFQSLDLDDNYAEPLASIYAFGFEYNTSFVKQTGPRIMRGLAVSEQALWRGASAKGIPASQYRNQLQQRYKVLLAALKAESASKEKTSGPE